MAEMNNPKCGLLLSDDLIFSSRVTGTARGLGLVVRTYRNMDQLVTAAHEQTAACVIVDLSNPGLKIDELIRRLCENSSLPYVVAYGSHVDTATLRAARAAGCTEVMPRSKFVEDLLRELPRWMGTTSSPTVSAGE